jgi:acetyl-CoA C-acetyltransferase
MVSGHPQRIASIPAVAAKLALQKIGMTIDDMDLIEVNEAFAAVPLVTTKVLAEGNEERLERIRSRTNVNGGAIAVGHPTGATGARLVMTLVYELRRRGGGFGLVTICGGIGEAESVIVKV